MAPPQPANRAAAGGRMPEGALGPRSAKIAGWKVHVRGAPWGCPRQGCQGSSSPMLEGGLATPSARPAGMRLALPAAGSRVGAGWIAASRVRTLRRLVPQLPLSLRELHNWPFSPSAAAGTLPAELRGMLVALGRAIYLGTRLPRGAGGMRIRSCSVK